MINLIQVEARRVCALHSQVATYILIYVSANIRVIFLMLIVASAQRVLNLLPIISQLS